MIKVSGLVKRYDGNVVLDNFDMNVKKGCVYGLVGPNGAGKTTVINHINGVIKPEEGKVEIDGENVYENLTAKNKIAYISDDWFYFGTYTIKQMAFFYRDIYRNFSMERYKCLSRIFGINDKKQIRKLSKGQKKQVAFWLSLCAMPEIMILDEPLDGLDPVMRKQVLNFVMEDVSERGMTVLVSSHNLRELEDICNWIGVIQNGRLIAEKPLDDLKGTVGKYQVVFSEDKEEFIQNLEGLMHKTKTGSVYNLIIKGDSNEIYDILNSESPILLEQISLTLEEVFIYELGGMGYDAKNIIF